MPDGEDSTLTAAWIRRVITRLKANGLTAELAEIERLQQTSNLPVLSWWRSWAGDLGAGAGIGSHAAMAGTNPQGRAWRAVRATIKTLQAEDRTAALAGEPVPDSLEATLVPLGPPPEAAPGLAKEGDLPARLNNATEADLDACILALRRAVPRQENQSGSAAQTASRRVGSRRAEGDHQQNGGGRPASPAASCQPSTRARRAGKPQRLA